MFIVAALYHFTRFKDHRDICSSLQDKCNISGVKGSLLLAPEGINGTISGTREGIDSVLEYIRTLPGCGRYSTQREYSFFAAISKNESKIEKRNCNYGSTQREPNRDSWEIC
jgi:UPF0176 protein